MKKNLLLVAVCCCLSYLQNTHAQSVPFPTTPPPYDVISPWGYQQAGTNWNTSNYLPFTFQNVWFRLMPPNGVTYNAATNSWNFSEPGKKYPVIVFNPGAGERGTDNNKQLLHGGEIHKNAVLSGKFPGWLLYWQTESGTVSANWLTNVVNRMIQTLNADPDRIYTHGLSRGGAMTWYFMNENPQLIAAAFPMSSAATIFSQSVVHIPVRLAQGGLDTNPLPIQSQEVVDDYAAGGGNLEYYYFENLGHGTWNTCYNLPDFFSWFLEQKKNNIHVFYGETEVCPGDPVNIKMGFTAGFSGYEWRKDGVTIAGATQNNYTATAFGTYEGRFRRGSTWTSWSDPVVIKEKQPTQTPTISTTGLQSTVLPTVAGNTSVQLQMPAGYANYTWKNAANGNVIGNERTIVISTPGQYVANVAEFGGCSSLDSPPFPIVAANGPNAPDAITNLTIAPQGLTSLVLTWENNPTPAFDETGFEIYRSTNSTGPWQLVKINPANILTYTDQNLISGDRYYYVIRAINGTGASNTNEPASGVTGLDEIAPTPPVNLTVVESSPSSVTLRWNASTDNVGIAAYDIYANGVKVYTSTTVASQVTFVVNGLQSSQLYNFVVRARDPAGNLSEPSQQVTRATTFTGLNYAFYLGDWNALPNFSQLVPAKVGWVPNFTLDPRTQNDYFAFRFSGKLNVPSTGTYRFALNSDDGSKLYIDGVLRVDHDGLHGATQLEGPAFTLTAGVHDIVVEQFEKTGGEALTVRWRRPGQSVQTIPASALTDVFTPPPTPGTPSGLAVAAVSYEALRVSWNTYSGSGSSIEIQQSTNNSTWLPLVTVPANTTQYTVTDLAANRRYYYRIRAIGSTGESSFTSSRNAFTLPLPPVPAPPSSLSASVANNIASLTWSDNSSNETEFEVFKSVGNNLNYSLLATVPAGSQSTATYQDQGLFAHTTYFYKVRSRNVSGTSAFSNEYILTTPNTSPILSPLNTFSMRFDEVKVVKIEATDNDGDIIIISGSNLPPFAQLYDYGDGTGEIFFEPTEADQADYQGILITAKDAFDGTTTLSFDLSVNNNHSPLILSYQNPTIRETYTETLTISATDEDGDLLEWELSDVPAFVSYESVGNNLNLIMNPSESDAGIHSIGIKVKDPQGSYTTTQLQIEVTEFNPDFLVNVNFGAATSVPANWNNFTNPNQGSALSNLIDDTGKQSEIGIILETSWSSSTATGGTFPGIYPNAVMNSFFSTASNADPEIFRITGLNPNNRYNFDFFGSRNSNEDRTTVFTINGVSSSVNATGNTSSLAEINNVVPSASGEVIVEVTAAVQYGYLNAMVIESFYEGNNPPAKPGALTIDYTEGETATRDIQLSWSDESDNEAGFEIFKGTDGVTFTKLVTTLPDVETFVDTDYTPFYTYHYVIRAINGNGYSEFSDTVSIEALNKLPAIDPVPPISLSEGDLKTVIVTATDPEGGSLMFFLQGAPGFVYLQYVNPNAMRLVASPLEGTNGVYNFQVGVMDQYGDISMSPVTINVTDFPENLVYINFSQTGINASAPWNNIGLAANFANAGIVIQNALDHHNVATTIDLRLNDAWGGANASGSSTGIYEPNVTRTALFYNGVSRTITLSGLLTDHVYDLTFFASRQEDNGGGQTNRNVVYSSGGKTATINASNNSNNIAKLTALSPNAAGELTFTVGRGTSNSAFIYLGSVIIREYKSNGLPNAPTNLSTKVLGRNKIRLTWVDQSDAETGFEIWRSTGSSSNFQLITTTAANTEAYEDNGLTQNTTYYYKVRAKVSATIFSPYSEEAFGTTFQYSVSINFGVFNPAAPPWNNIMAFLGTPGDFQANLVDDAGANTGMRLVVVNPFVGDNPYGMNTGNNSGVVPDAVMEGSWWLDPGISGVLRVENLNLALSYTFEFFASRDGGGNRNTDYTINGKTATLNAAFNTQNTVQIKDILPDQNGGVTIQVKASPNSTFAYINGLIIQAATPSHGGGAAARTRSFADNAPEAQSSLEVALEDAVLAYPNPFTDQITITSQYKAKIADVSLIDALGSATRIAVTPGSDGAVYLETRDLNLTNGFYFLRILFADGANRVIKLAKE